MVLRISLNIMRELAVVAVMLFAVARAGAAPALVSTSATDDGGNPTTSLTTDPILSYTFDVPAFPGSGNILLMESGGATSQTYNVTSDTRLSFGGSTLTITPDVLSPDTSYFVRIPNGAIEDGSGGSTGYPDSALTFTTGPFLTVAISNGKTTYTTDDLRGLDPTGYDKLVVCAMAESSFPSTMSWGASNLTLVVQQSDGGAQRAAMWFIDGPFTGPKSFYVNNASVGLSFLALKGTAPGVAAFDGVASSSNNFTTTSAESFVVAGFNQNGNSPRKANPPLTTYFSRLTASGSSSGSSGVCSNSTAGTQTFSFNGSGAFAIAEFVVGLDVNPPAISGFIPADDAGNSTNSLLTDAILNIDFSELIYPGTGSIRLRKAEDDAIAESYDVTSSTKLAFSTGRLTITPDVLEPETSYYVDITNGVIEDGAGNSTNYPGDALAFATGPWLSIALNKSTSYSPTDMRGFDPSGYDKLVALTMAERSTPPVSVTWGSSNMILVTSNTNKDGPPQSIAMWYLDGPFTGPASLDMGGNTWGVSLLALKGMEPGVVAFASASGLTVDLTTTSDESYVVAGCQANSGDPRPLAPLEAYFRRPNGAEQAGSGVFTNLTEGTQAFSFNSGSTPSIVIAEFLITPPPAGTVLVIR